MTALDHVRAVRERIPGRVFDLADTAFTVVLYAIVFIIMAAIPYGVLTGDLSVTDAVTVGCVIYGIPTLCYVVGRIRGDSEMIEAGAVVVVKLVVYTVLGVGAAVAPSPVNTVVFYAGIAVAGILVVKYDLLASRLGFETAGEEVAA